jgi:hypothetical protein
MRVRPVPPVWSEIYAVTRAWQTNLEPGTWYEISYLGKSGLHDWPLIAGFVFVPRRVRPGNPDPHAHWDFREVDGKCHPHWRKSMKWGDSKKWDDREAGFISVIEAYHGIIDVCQVLYLVGRNERWGPLSDIITPALDRVEIVWSDAEDQWTPGHFTVWTYWKGVDRPCTHGIGVNGGYGGRRLAERLKAAIEAGVVFTDLGVGTDVDGKTYVTSKCRVLARILNADLRRLGF